MRPVITVERGTSVCDITTLSQLSVKNYPWKNYGLAPRLEASMISAIASVLSSLYYKKYTDNYRGFQLIFFNLMEVTVI